jgi:hypothetical protein
MFKNAFVMYCLIGMLAFNSCKNVPPDEAVIKEAFEAIKSKDWERYSRLTITTYDYALKENKIGPFQEQQSFTGGVLKPQEIKSQREAFEKAVKGGEGIINFGQAEFISLGSLKEIGNIPTLSGEPIQATAYSLRIKQGQAEIDTKDIDPIFFLARWGEQCRIIKMTFRNS